MGKGKTQVVGGGAARPVADQFSNYLGGFMNPQGGQPGANGALQQTLGMGQATNNLLSGRIGDPTSLQQYFNSGMGSNGMANIGQSNAQFNPTQVNGGYGFNPAQSSYQAADINSQFNPSNFQNVNLLAPQTGAPGVGGVNTQYSPQQIQGQYQNPQFQQTQLGQLQQLDPNMLAQMGQVVNPQADLSGMQALQDRQLNRNVADLRARFGASGGTAFGTGAQFAEGNYRAEADAQNQAQLAQFMQQQQGLGLQQRGQSLNAMLGAQGNNTQGILGQNTQQLQQGLAQNQFNQQGSQFGSQLGMQGQLANQQAGLQAAGFGQQGQIANQDAMLRQMGLSNEAIAQINQQSLQQGLASNQFGQQNQQFGANLDMQAQMQNQQNQQAQNDAMLRAYGMNAQQGQFGANMGMQAGQLNNQFAQQAAQMGQQNQQFDINAMLQNQGMGNQWNMGMQGMGAQLQGQQLQAQQAALAQLMGGLGQTQELGTPQARLQYKPSWGSQLFNGAMQVGNMIGNMIPGGSGGGSTPNITMPTPIYQPLPSNFPQYRP